MIMDLTKYIEAQEPIKHKKTVTCYVSLDKKSMLNALQSDAIYINGECFKTPEHILLECLINKRFGETKLELEKID